MSLQVWLPLNGNLNNQGLSDITVTNRGATANNSGKIGSCYSFDTGKYLTVTRPAAVTKEISYSCWVNITSWNSTTYDCILSIATGSSWYSSIATLCRNGSGTNLTWNIADGSSRSYVNSKTSLSLNTWYHVACTYDGAKLRIYINGVEDSSASTSLTPNYGSANLYIGSWSGDNYNLKGCLNDVRVYDHCLSAKEVKEISKELCLHYKLADPYIESTTNLYSGWSTNCYNGATNKYNYGTSTDVYYDNLDGIIRVRMGTNNLDAWPYVFFNNITPPSNGEYRTLSFDYYPTIKDGVNFYTYNTSGTITWIANGVKGTGGNIPVNTNSWNHISVTIKNTGSSDSGYGYMRIGLEKHTSNTSNYWLFKNIQVEDKDHSTPFVVGSRNESTVYDCSGLANNGTKIGGVTPSSNPLPIRYDKSYDFDGNTSSIQIPNLATLVPSGEFTMNCWIYHDDTWSSKGYETIFGGPSGFELEAKNTSTNAPVLHAWSWGKGTATYELNKWNMITMTRNTSETKFYINGELKITGSAGTIPSGNYFIGAWNTSSQQNYKGRISDFRLYSTVLSVEDIKELYSTSASIDKNGNMYAYEFKEE